MKIKELTEEEAYDALENNIVGVFYYKNKMNRYYCILITELKKTVNIWNCEEFAFKWMNNVIEANFINII